MESGQAPVEGQRIRSNYLAALGRALQFVGLLLLAGAALGDETERHFRVGITSFRDKSVTLREWQPTMDYLSSRIPGTRFEAVPMTLPEFEIALGKKELDFVITNPQHYILMETVYGVSRIATLVKKEEGQLVNRFGGVIFTRSDRNDIHRLEDIKGKTIASVDRTSFAAFLLQYDLLLQHGINIDKVCRVEFLGFPQDLSISAVLEGKADVGFVRTGVIEAMSREGKIDISRLRVLNPSPQSNFPFLLSTALFPEWPLAVAPQVPVDITNQVAAALLVMPPDSPATKSARYHRWSTPVEYISVQNLMRRHRIYPYDKAERIALQDILQQYSIPITLALFTLALVMAMLYIHTRRLNSALKASRQQMSELAHHDPLTGLPNRNMLDHDLDKAIARTRRKSHELAVCLIDLDGFKPINDKWGHDVGDKVLREIGRRLQGALRAGDTVARWGGDEFVLLLNDVATRRQLEEIMERILEAISQPLGSCRHPRVSASIGVSLCPTNAGTAPELLRQADEAMYYAKRNGGDRFALHDQVVAEPFPTSVLPMGSSTNPSQTTAP